MRVNIAVLAFLACFLLGRPCAQAQSDEPSAGTPTTGQPAADVLASHDGWGNPTFIGGLSWERRIGSEMQLALIVEELFGTIPESGALVVVADVPVVIAALRVTTNARGYGLLAPLPSAASCGRAAESVIPWISNGAGEKSEIVLINETDESVRANVALYDASGARAPMGMDSELMLYAIPRRSSRTFVSDGAGAMAHAGYAVIIADDAHVPPASALVRYRSGDVDTSESLVHESRGSVHHFGVQLESTLIRHGEVDTVVYATNPGGETAELRITMAGGGTCERMLAPGQQRAISLRAWFGTAARGIVSVESDVPVSVTARQRTVNLRGERVEMGLSPLSDARRFPYVPNGQGLSTELRLANPSGTDASGVIELRLANGEPARDAILR